MKVKEDQQRLKELLKDTITLLCKNGLQYKDELSVEALIGITLDQNNVFLVNIKETVQMPNKNGEASDSSDYSDNESSNKFEQVTSPKSGKKRRYSENTSGTSMTPSKQQKIQPVAVKETVLDIKNEESECDNDEDLVFVKEEQQGVRQQITPPMGSVFPGSYGSPVVKVTGGTAASGDLTIQNTTSIDSSSFMQQSPGMWGGSKTAGNQQTLKQRKENTLAHRKRYRNYGIAQLKQALELCDKGMNVSQASRQTGVPKSTITDRLSGLIPRDTFKSGPRTNIPEEHEKEMAKYLSALNKYGYWYARSDIGRHGKYLIRLLGRTNDNKDSFSSKWAGKYLERNSDFKIVNNVPRPTSIKRLHKTTLQKSCIDVYYSDLKDILIKYMLDDKPSQVFYMEDLVFPTVESCDENFPTEEQNLNICRLLNCFNATGKVLPPFMVHNTILSTDGSVVLEEVPEGMKIMGNENSDIDSFTFKYFINEHFVKQSNAVLMEGLQENDQVYKLVLYDGHSTYVNHELVNTALEQNVVLFPLPAHASTVLQPVDIQSSNPLREAYNTEAEEYMRENCKVVEGLEICNLVTKAFNKAIVSDYNQYAKSFFEECGIVPFNQNIVEVESD